MGCAPRHLVRGSARHVERHDYRPGTLSEIPLPVPPRIPPTPAPRRANPAPSPSPLENESPATLDGQSLSYTAACRTTAIVANAANVASNDATSPSGAKQRWGPPKEPRVTTPSSSSSKSLPIDHSPPTTNNTAATPAPVACRRPPIAPRPAAGVARVPPCGASGSGGRGTGGRATHRCHRDSPSRVGPTVASSCRSRECGRDSRTRPRNDPWDRWYKR